MVIKIKLEVWSVRQMGESFWRFDLTTVLFVIQAACRFLLTRSDLKSSCVKNQSLLSFCSLIFYCIYQFKERHRHDAHRGKLLVDLTHLSWWKQAACEHFANLTRPCLHIANQMRPHLAVSSPQITVFQFHGDCKVSLHKGWERRDERGTENLGMERSVLWMGS